MELREFKANCRGWGPTCETDDVIRNSEYRTMVCYHPRLAVMEFSSWLLLRFSDFQPSMKMCQKALLCFSFWLAFDIQPSFDMRCDSDSVLIALRQATQNKRCPRKIFWSQENEPIGCSPHQTKPASVTAQSRSLTFRQTRWQQFVRCHPKTISSTTVCGIGCCNDRRQSPSRILNAQPVAVAPVKILHRLVTGTWVRTSCLYWVEDGVAILTHQKVWCRIHFPVKEIRASIMVLQGRITILDKIEIPKLRSSSRAGALQSPTPKQFWRVVFNHCLERSNSFIEMGIVLGEHHPRGVSAGNVSSSSFLHSICQL